MPSIVRCPECQKQLRIQDEMLGKKIRCPGCQAVIAAPLPEEPPLVQLVDEEEAVTADEPPRRRDDGRRRGRDREDDFDEPGARRKQDRRRPDRDYRDELDDRDNGKRKIPSSVILAIVAMCVMMGLELLLFVLALTANLPPQQLGRVVVQTAGGVVIGGLILWGLVAGHRLAWQWGRILGMLGAILLLASGILILTLGQANDRAIARFVTAGLNLVISTCLFTIAFSLGTASAKKHFGLRCPSCGRFTSSASDFLFNRAKCKDCGEVW